MDLTQFWYILSMLISIDSKGFTIHWAGLFIAILVIIIYELVKLTIRHRLGGKATGRSIR